MTRRACSVSVCHKCHVCHQERGRGATRLVAPQCNLGRVGSELRGERWILTWSLKIPRSPKDGCQGNRGEDGYWASHHFYCQLPCSTGSLSLQQVRFKDVVQVGLKDPVWHFSRHESTLCSAFSSQSMEIWRRGVMDSARIAAQLSNSHYHYGSCWLQGSFGQMERASDVWGKPRLWVDNGQNTSLFVQSCLSHPRSAMPSLIPLPLPRFSLVSPPPASLSPFHVLVCCVPPLPPPMPASTCSQSTSPTPSVPAATQSLKLM